jgi:hypothetical protein
MVDVAQLESDRLKNTVRSFGWEWLGSEASGEVVKHTFVKDAKGMVPSVRMFEVERIGSLCRSLGWSLVTSSIDGDVVRVVVEKKVGGVA